MKLSAKEKKDFRKQIEDKLVSVPEGQRISLPKEILEELLFDVIQFRDKKIPSIKVPVWSGSFLSKLNLSMDGLFENVSWYINDKARFADIFFGSHGEDLDKKMGTLSDELFEYTKQHYREKNTVVYSNTNANIDFRESWEAKMTGIIYISNCDFRGTDLSKIIENIIYIDESDMRNTGIKLFPGKVGVTDSNLEGVDLSAFEVDLKDMLGCDIFFNCNLKNTGIRINNFSQEVVEYFTDPGDIKSQFENGYFDGCYINGLLIKSKEEQQKIAQQMRNKYKHDDLIISTLSDIDDQINKMKK